MSWVPTQLSSLKLWLDAADTSTVTVSTGVSEWLDKSGNGYHLSQPTASAQPNYVSGSHVGFTVNDQFLQVLSRFGLAANPDISVISVATPFDAGNFTAEFWWQLGGSSAGNLGGSFGADGYAWRFNNGNKRFGSISNDTQQLIVMSRAASSNYGASEFFRNGTGLTSTGSGNPSTVPTSTTARFELGSGQSTTPIRQSSNCRINEFVILESSSATDRQEVEGYLAHKWGLDGSLPSDHPYKAAPPSAGTVPTLGTITTTATTANSISFSIPVSY